MSADLLIYVLRPDGTALYLPPALAHELRRRPGSRLTPEQYASEPVQRLIEERLAAEKKGKPRGS